MSTLIPLAALVIFILGYGVFVLLKASLSRASISVLERDVQDGAWGAKLAVKVVEQADRHILAGHVGRFLCSFSSGVSAVLIFRPLSDVVAKNLPWMPVLALDLIIAGLLALIIAFLAMLTVQIAKSLAVQSPEKILSYLGWFCTLFSRLMSPVLVPVDAFMEAFEKSGRIERVPSERELTLSAEDLETVIEHSTQAGTLDNAESELLQGALRLNEIKVREIMTPRADIISVDLDCTIQGLRDVVGDAGFSRVLVTGEQLDDVRGMLLAKDLIPLTQEGASGESISKLMREVLFVDGELNGDEVLLKLRDAQAHLAVVLDEHGGVDGIVTLEDLIEEIVGDIFDETDVLEEERDIIVIHSGEILVDGGTALADLESEHGVVLPEGEYDTVAGFVIDQLGRIPEIGEKVSCNGSLLLVEQVEENRVTQLRISFPSDQDAA